ncbi:hypothetical protein [Pseudomonas syringae]|uniref:hypothetical protein n=1 Tax=Pseudomonas syringae TaxID=317 RepID=UPI000A70AEFC|nr:hypothetical protein [Pseudomonas syringae]
MKLLNSFAEQIKACGKLKRVWLTSFNIDIEFIETYLLPADSTTLGHSAHDHLDTHSKLTYLPHVHLDRQSERSDAGLHC